MVGDTFYLREGVVKFKDNKDDPDRRQEEQGIWPWGYAESGKLETKPGTPSVFPCSLSYPSF